MGSRVSSGELVVERSDACNFADGGLLYARSCTNEEVIGMSLNYVDGLQIHAVKRNDSTALCRLRVVDDQFGLDQCVGRKLFVQEM